MFEASWVGVIIASAQFILTVGLVIWRVSALVATQGKIAAEAMSKHQLSDTIEFGMLHSKIESMGATVRAELSSGLAEVRDELMRSTSELQNKISGVELVTANKYVDKELFYQVMSDFRLQTKEDFLEIKESLKNLDKKLENK